MSDHDRLHGFAAALAAHFGDRAIEVVERQIASARDDPSVADVWRRIAERILEDERRR